jgi:MFS transporter, FHS family, glucose/mannose:H+ symporter
VALDNQTNCITSLDCDYFFTSAELGLSAWLVTYFQKVKGFPPGIASASLSIFWIAILAGRAVNFRLPGTLSLPVVIRIEVLGSILSVVIILLGRSPSIIYFGTFLDGLFIAGLFPNLMAFANHNASDSIGSISGITLFGARIGMTLGPVAIGFLADWGGLGSALYLPLLMLVIIEAVFFFKISNR